MKFKFINNDTFITVITHKVDNKSWNNPDSHFSSRDVDKILSCRVNTTSRRGIKHRRVSFGSIFLLFSNKSSPGPHS